MKLKYEFVINKVAGETVAVSVGNTAGAFNGYIKLNDTGAFIFKLLKNEISRERIIEKLCEQYPDANEKDATESVDELLQKLSEAELLI